MSCPRAEGCNLQRRHTVAQFVQERAGHEGKAAQDTADADQPIGCPTLVLWGADFAAGPGIFDVMEIWKGMAREVRGVEIPQCGHLPLEEQPEVVNRELLAFLDGWSG